MTVEILVGDCREVLKTMPEQSVHTCVTSPPYFGLRDYGHDGQLGLEPTPDAYVAALVEVFREVRRVLRDDGTVWLNLGDSYANVGKWGGSSGGKHTKALHGDTGVGRGRRDYGDLKPKDLIGIPWAVAFALQADGWYLRQDIIWHKPNPMPESVRDRCTKAHEYIFLLSKSAKYYFDSDAIAEPSIWHGRDARSDKGNIRYEGKRTVADAKANGQQGFATINKTRNRRSVWTVTTKPFKGAHFATFPPDLIEPCILAGCPEGGVALDPFGGAGTTGLVADKHGRNAILIELNEAYRDIAVQRLKESPAQRNLL